MSDKPKPIKVFGRSHYACSRCKASKIKCSGESPCATCKNNNTECIYMPRNRKIMIMEGDLNQLHDRVKYLEGLVQQQPQQIQTPTDDTVLIGSTSMIQERSNAETKEFLFNHTGLEDFLISDNSNELVKWRLVEVCNNALPTKAETVELIRKVLDNYAHEFYLIDYKTFSGHLDTLYVYFDSIKNNNSELTTSLNKQIKRSVLCYFFVLLAYGQQISNTANDDIPGLQFYLVAAELFNLTQEEISIEFIQSATLLALYSSNLNRYNTVYNYFGVAVRSAISKGLHRQILLNETDDNALIYREKAKRLWWTIFITDSTWTSKMNMPAQIDYTETDVDLPTENSVDLYDSFDINMLELNVHLAKFIAKSVQKIYGANKRSFSVNYINTDQFNQKELIKNVLTCFSELIRYYETPYLLQYKNCNIIEPRGRKLVNLFLRFNLLIARVTKPLISLIFKKTDVNIFENPIEVEEAINKTISTATSTFNILFKLYEIDRLFIIGFYDSEYVYTAIVIMIMTSITDPKCLNSVNRGVALLKHMASNGNINAKNCMKKLSQVNDYLSQTPELSFRINFDLDIKMFFENKPFVYEDHYYNPYERSAFSSVSEFKIFKNNLKKQKQQKNTFGDRFTPELTTSLLTNQASTVDPTPPETFFNQEFIQDDFGNMVDQFTNNRVFNLSGTSQNTLHSMMNNLYNWDDYKNFTM